jgi:hypothetical protein
VLLSLVIRFERAVGSRRDKQNARQRPYKGAPLLRTAKNVAKTCCIVGIPSACALDMVAPLDTKAASVQVAHKKQVRSDAS